MTHLVLNKVCHALSGVFLPKSLNPVQGSVADLVIIFSTEPNSQSFPSTLFRVMALIRQTCERSTFSSLRPRYQDIFFHGIGTENAACGGEDVHILSQKTRKTSVVYSQPTIGWALLRTNSNHREKNKQTKTKVSDSSAVYVRFFCKKSGFMIESSIEWILYNSFYNLIMRLSVKQDFMQILNYECSCSLCLFANSRWLSSGLKDRKKKQK